MKMPADMIREEIRQHGGISFARFMELALYCPETGYYERNRDNVGIGGDFITSVSTGSLFGELLAFQFAEWLELFKSQKKNLNIIEAGAHDAKLASDILRWLKVHRPKLFTELEYTIIEPSQQRRHWQRQTLSDYSNIRWVDSPADLHTDRRNPIHAGILFGNELLDAFPVHRLGWDALAKRWFEWGIVCAADRFIWQQIELQLAPPALPAALTDVLPDGYVLELSPAAERWWRSAAQALPHGKMMAIDYGLTLEEQISPARTMGTLRAYHRHQLTDDLLAKPGDQDLTAHVNFTAIQAAGEKEGWRTEGFCSQPQFLTRIFSRAARENFFARFDAKQVRQFQTLTHPEHLGRAFRVLVQARD